MNFDPAIASQHDPDLIPEYMAQDLPLIISRLNRVQKEFDRFAPENAHEDACDFPILRGEVYLS
jgi:hypothetical protein